MPSISLQHGWAADPLVLAVAAVAALQFSRAFRTLRRRGRADHAGWDRAALFAAGLLLATLPLVSPLDLAGDDYLLSAHMLEHMLIGDAAPALLLVAVRGPLLAFMVPASATRFVHRSPSLRGLVASATRPAVTLALWASAFGAWHIPALYDAALRHPWLHDLEHLSFVTAGLLVWMQLVDPARRGRLSLGRRIAFAGAVFGIGQILSDVLFLSPSPLYSAYAGRPPGLFGLSPLADQQYAGLVMMAEQLLTLGTCVWVLVITALPRVRNSSAPLSLPAR